MDGLRNSCIKHVGRLAGWWAMEGCVCRERSDSDRRRAVEREIEGVKEAKTKGVQLTSTRH